MARMTCPTCGLSWEVQASQSGRVLTCHGCWRKLTVDAALFQGEPTAQGGIALRLLGAVSHLLPEERFREAYLFLLQGVSVELIRVS